MFRAKPGWGTLVAIVSGFIWLGYLVIRPERKEVIIEESAPTVKTVGVLIGDIQRAVIPILESAADYPEIATSLVTAVNQFCISVAETNAVLEAKRLRRSRRRPTH